MPRKSTKHGLDSAELNELLESARLTDERLNGFWAVMSRRKVSSLDQFTEKLWKTKNSDKFTRHAAAIVRQTGIPRHFRWEFSGGGFAPCFIDLIAANYAGYISDRAFEVVLANFKCAYIDHSRAKAAALRPAGPLLARDSAPPTNNMGGTNQAPYFPFTPEMVLSVSGSRNRKKLLEVTARKGPNAKAGFVDWVNFTVHEETCERLRPYDHMEGTELVLNPMVSDDDYIACLSAQLECVFGFGVTEKRKGGMNFYKQSYVLGEKWGFVCIGGQRGTILVMLNGTGCAAAAEGWEQRLHDYLSEHAVQPKITRLDVAYDDFAGQQYGVDQAAADYALGLYTCHHAKPDIQRLGNWDEPNGKGRTITFGVRASGKFARIYEKGKQLGCPASDWVRVEVELKAIDRIIDLDCLLQPGSVLASTYPALSWIHEDQKRIETIRKTSQTTYENAKFWLKRQYGALLGVIAEIEGGIQAAFDEIVIPNKVPPRLVVPDHRDSLPSMAFHRRPMTPVLPIGAMQFH